MKWAALGLTDLAIRSGPSGFEQWVASHRPLNKCSIVLAHRIFTNSRNNYSKIGHFRK
jgi:hypothetical protein